MTSTTTNSSSSSIKSSLTTHNSAYFQIFVRGFEGNTILLGQDYALQKSTRIGSLKDIIAKRTGIGRKEILLIYATKQLSDNADEMTLEYYGISNESTLLMVGRLRGGSWAGIWG